MVNQFLSLWGCLVAFLGALFVMESNAKPIGDVNTTKNRVLQEIALLELDIEAYIFDSQVPISNVTIRQALKKRIKAIKALINE